MPRLNQGQISQLSCRLHAQQTLYKNMPIKEAAAEISEELGFDISEAQLAKTAESINLPLTMPEKRQRTSKNDAILESLKRIEDKLDKVIG